MSFEPGSVGVVVGKFNPPHLGHLHPAIGLYLSTEAYMFAALYVLFLVMAFVGLAKWMRAESEGVA